MPPKPKGHRPKTTSPRLTIPDEVRKLANKKGVIIYFISGTNSIGNCVLLVAAKTDLLETCVTKAIPYAEYR